jgi:hypothetical protein
MRMPSSQLSPAAGLVALLLTLTPVRGQAQATADTAGRGKPADSTATGAGYNAGQAGVDTSQGTAATDTAAKAAKAPGDSAPAAPAAPALAADSV